MFKHKLLSVGLALVASIGFLTTARAQSPHFVRGPNAVFDTGSGDLCVNFKEAGLGNTPITYTLSVGTELFTFQCFTRHDNTPNGDPNGISLSDQSVQTTITPRNGQITGSLCAEVQQGDADCQGGGLVLKLIAASYTDITFCDSTNNICVDLGNAGGVLNPPVSFGRGNGH
jgi:hypothetical protein